MAEITALGETRTSPSHLAAGDAVAEWLASAHPSPSAVRREWESAAKLALIPLGSAFAAVRLPYRIVHAAVESDDTYVVHGRLAQYLHGGPVIHDPGFCRYYALVPPGTADAWPAPVVECLGAGTYLGVPSTDRTEFDDSARSAYWLVPMTRPGRLCQAADVVTLVMLGGCLSEDDES
ncbi:MULTISPECIES: hypothetical protein [Streptomyces]|uniref:hypothetical protein n=1 Tax=Streptomyces TaxID=1883 RepID=UPI0018D8BBFD|nr:MULTISPECIES: hypothetical protein [Streptomyces]